MEEKVDLLIIGSGPAGQKGAIAGAKFGKKTVIIESGKIGGGSLFYGTIPSKTLREAILNLTNYTKKSFYATFHPAPKLSDISVGDLSYQMKWVQSHLQETIERQLSKNRIEIVKGIAKFIDPHKVVVYDESGKTLRIFIADKILLCVGSRPRKPPGIHFDGKHIMDSNQILHLEEIPQSLIILGAGVIGSEFASMFSVLGVKVYLVDKKSRFLGFLDREISAHLQLSMEENNLIFYGSKDTKNVEVLGPKKTRVTFADGMKVEAEAILVAAGRVSNIDLLDAHNAGLEVNQFGILDVNEMYQTKIKHIYAAGDVIGGPSLSSTSYQQGRLAVFHAYGKILKKTDLIYPYGIYTIPEVSIIGKTEEQLKKEGSEYEVGRAYYYEVSRSIIEGSECGVCKILFHPKNLSIYGVHIVGHGATEIIHIATAAMTFNATIEYFIEEVFNFPTYAEMYKIAALNGLNKLHISNG